MTLTLHIRTGNGVRRALCGQPMVVKVDADYATCRDCIAVAGEDVRQRLGRNPGDIEDLFGDFRSTYDLAVRRHRQPARRWNPRDVRKQQRPGRR